MTRGQRINKLASAIRDYKGTYDPGTLKWIVSPQRGALARITRWLTELGYGGQLDACMLAIEGFKVKDHMRDFLQRIDKGLPPPAPRPKLHLPATL